MAQAGYTPIQLYYSTTASAAPSSGNLANGELALNITDGKLYYKDNGGTVRVLAGTGGTGVVAGSNTQVQFNNNGVFGASSGLTFDGTTLTANALTVSNAVTLSAGTANGVAYLNGSKVLTTGSALTFDGTILTVGNAKVETGSGYAGLNTVGAIPFNFYINNAEQMRLTSTGLGIGTSSPGYKLTVAGGDIALDNTRAINFKNAAGGYGNVLSVDSSNRVNFGDLVTSASAMVLASGNLGLGVTPSAWGSSYKAFEQVGGAIYSINNQNILMTQNAYDNGTNYIYKTTSRATSYQQSNGQHFWFTAPSGTAGNAISFTQAMTLDASGNLLVGTTSTSPRDFTSGSGTRIPQPGAPFEVATTDSNCVFINYTGTANGSANLIFFRQQGSLRGTISTNGSSVSYNTSSDYRLKEDIAPMTGALAKVAALKPVTYKWKADGSDGEGFIAHELQAVVPQCVTGEKDAVDAEGKPVYQGIDTSFLVATLTSAIQEQQAIIEQLKARLDAANL